MLISELNKEKKRCESNISSIRSNIVKVSKEIDENKKDIAKSNMYVIDNMGYSDIKIITTSEKDAGSISWIDFCVLFVRSIEQFLCYGTFGNRSIICYTGFSCAYIFAFCAYI